MAKAKVEAPATAFSPEILAALQAQGIDIGDIPVALPNSHENMTGNQVQAKISSTNQSVAVTCNISATDGGLSKSGKSILIAYEKKVVSVGGRQVTVQFTAYEKL